MARKLDVSSAQLSQLISGTKGITPKRAEEIAQALGYTLNLQLIQTETGEVEE
ncbi:helix-turn-helix domain-containing protein [Deinococcus peraridilitoris]|uniref:Helix-turn-helix protein n=1 Tax=Deinococcus peraridilitoris (strain DSM 19664 / LMG 22246 / CIP 109416 / KR-200) TaxID=937777 RepID=L0A0X8_DEIPD|nr:helix-turn-helix domain-containing protein [Deinococcus peraridilitoris]AFZ67094.1 Helix-turn-helix protein [Deinococcus peraridilitoris DSM 19664]